MRGSTRRLLPAVLFLPVLAMAPYVAFLDGYFLADDLMLESFLLEDGSFSLARLGNHFFPTTGYVGRQIYRPFDFVVMSVDWLFWGINPVGYHLSNTAFHVWCTLLVFFLIRRLGRGPDLFPALLGGILFALHPLNPEAVQWIVGRVDLTSCFFTLLAMLCLVRYRQTDRRFFLAGILVSLGMGLLSKDVVIFLPVYFVLHDVCLCHPLKKLRENAKRWNLLSVHVYSAALVGVYFLLRKLCFGEFLGRYDAAGNPVAFDFSSRWTEGLGKGVSLVEQMLFPLRETVWTPGEGAAVWACLLLGYLALVLLAVIRGVTREAGPSRAALFSCLWMAVTLAPLVYLLLLLPISRDHLNARLAYLPVAAFSMAVPLLLFSAEHWGDRSWVRLRIVISCIVPVVYFFLTVTYNDLFHRAGRSTNSIRTQVLEWFHTVEPSTPVLIENPPLEMTGVYALRTGLSFLLKPPLSPVQVPVLGLNLTTPDEFGRFLSEHRKRPLILRWCEKSMRVEAVTRPVPAPLPQWQGESLRHLEVVGARGRVENQVLLVTRNQNGKGFLVRAPVGHVRPGDLDCLVLDLRLCAGEILNPVIRVSGCDEQGQRLEFPAPAGTPVGKGAPSRRIYPLRFHLETYGEGRGRQFRAMRRIESFELLFPPECDQVEIRSLKLQRGFPGLTLLSPEEGVHHDHTGPGLGFSFLALDGVRYYRLVLEIENLGVRRARFDAWALNNGIPIRAGQTLLKPLDATGNLDSTDFAFDLQGVPPGDPGEVLPFTWKIEALADPERPWMILAESETRQGVIK